MLWSIGKSTIQAVKLGVRSLATGPQGPPGIFEAAKLSPSAVGRLFVAPPSTPEEIIEQEEELDTPDQAQDAPPLPTRIRDGMEVPYIPEPSSKWHNWQLELLRRSNQTIPLRGQVIVGRVVDIDDRTLLVDTGFRFHQRFNKKELSVSSVVSRADGSEPVRSGEEDDFQIGDVFHLLVRHTNTPYGDMQLEVLNHKNEMRTQAVVTELQQAMSEHRLVMGRVLNAVNKGYAVGIAGIVAFLPSSRARLNTIKRIGALQPFYVLSVNQSHGINVVVADPYPSTKQRQIIRGPVRGRLRG